MKVLFIAPRFHTNQVGWIRSLLSAGHDVQMNVLLKGATENYSDIQPQVFKLCTLSKIIIKVFGDGGANLFRGFPAPSDYYQYLLQLKPDVVIVRDIRRYFSLLAAVCARFTGARIVIYSQTALHKKYSPSRRLLTWLALTIFRAAWMTPILGDINSTSSHPNHMYYVPFTVDILKEKESYVAKTIRILSIGKFQERKNHPLLLKALKKLELEGLNFSLSIIGEVSITSHKEELRKVNELIIAGSLDTKVKVHTNIPNSKIASFYKNADIFILPATSEPASISILEAMGFGLPVICSNTCGTRWYVKAGISGFWFEDGSPESLVNTIKKLLDHETLRKMQKTTLESARRELDNTVFYSSFLDMIKTRFPELEV